MDLWFTVRLGREKKKEEQFKKSVDKFRENTSQKAVDRISKVVNGITKSDQEHIKGILDEEININSPDMGIKSIIDSQKKKILISQTSGDKDLADIIYEMLKFNGVPGEDIIYTNCDDQVSRIPLKSSVYDYLRNFFVESYSTQKIYVLFVTSHKSKVSWGALVEVGAAWITQIDHTIFNIHDFRPEHPLDDERQWHVSFRSSDGNLYMSALSVDIFCEKIELVCKELGYSYNSRDINKQKLESLVKVE